MGTLLLELNKQANPLPPAKKKPGKTFADQDWKRRTSSWRNVSGCNYVRDCGRGNITEKTYTNGLCVFSSFISVLTCFWVAGSLLPQQLLQLLQAGAALQLRCWDFSLRWLLLLWSTGSRMQAQQLLCRDLVPLWGVESSQTRNWTHVPCMGRQILNQWTAREVPMSWLF